MAAENQDIMLYAAEDKDIIFSGISDTERGQILQIGVVTKIVWALNEFESSGQEPLIKITSAGDTSIPDPNAIAFMPEDGIITVSLTSASTASLDPGVYSHELRIIAQDKQYVLARGKALIKSDLTNGI
jgi:hypothetical protein